MDIASTNMSEKTITLCETRVRGDDFAEDKRFEILDQRFPEKRGTIAKLSRRSRTKIVIDHQKARQSFRRLFQKHKCLPRHENNLVFLPLDDHLTE